MLDHNRSCNGGLIVRHSTFKIKMLKRDAKPISSLREIGISGQQTLGGPGVTAEYQSHDGLNGCFVVDRVREEPRPSERHDEYQR